MRLLPHSPLVVVTALAAVGSAAAAAGRTPIWQPTTITEPGAYYLARDLSGSGTLIEIAASGVDLDLAGHTLTGDGTNIAVHADGHDDLNIHDGYIATIDEGVQVRAGDGVRIARITVHDAAAWGLRVDGGAAAFVRDCVVAPGNGRYGMYVNAFTLPVVARSRFEAFTNTTFSMQGSGAAPRLDENVLVCPDCSYSVIADGDAALYSANRLNGAVFAFMIPGRGRVERNIVTGASTGIAANASLADDVVLEDNLVRGATVGIQVRGLRNELRGNLTLGGVIGLTFTSSSSNGVIGGNVSRGNITDLSGGAACTTAGDNFVPNLY